MMETAEGGGGAWSPIAVVVLVFVAVVLVEAVAAVQELVEVSHVAKEMNRSLGRRDMAVLFDALGQDLQQYAEFHREKIASKRE
jgi:hypothetical protein